MAEFMAMTCGICNEPFEKDLLGKEVEALLCCGHIFHSDCVRKFENQSDIILRVCYDCKKDYSKLGTFKLTPAFQTIQLEILNTPRGEYCGVGEHKGEIKALKIEIKNLKGQMKKDAKIAAEQQKSAELKETIAKNKIRRLVTDVRDLNSSMMKYIDASDFETEDETVVAAVEAQAQSQGQAHVLQTQTQSHISTSTRSKDKEGSVSTSADAKTDTKAGGGNSNASDTKTEDGKKASQKTVTISTKPSRSGSKRK